MKNTITLCTFENLLKISEPINNRLIEIFNEDRVKKGVNLITEKEAEQIKVSNTFPLAKMLYKYADVTDELVECDLHFSQASIGGTIRFKRNGEIYYIETSSIIAGGIVQRMHIRFICNSTNAPRKDAGNVKEITKRVSKLEKLFVYVNDVESTEEFEYVGHCTSRLNECIDKLEYYKTSSDKDLFVSHGLSNINIHIEKFTDIITKDFVCYSISNDHELAKLMEKYCGIDYTKSLHIQHKQYAKFIKSVTKLDGKSDEYRRLKCDLYNQYKLSLSGYIQTIIDNSYDQKLVNKIRKSLIKAGEKEVIKADERVNFYLNKINNNIAEYKQLIGN